MTHAIAWRLIPDDQIEGCAMPKLLAQAREYLIGQSILAFGGCPCDGDPAYTEAIVFRADREDDPTKKHAVWCSVDDEGNGGGYILHTDAHKNEEGVWELCSETTPVMEYGEGLQYTYWDDEDADKMEHFVVAVGYIECSSDEDWQYSAPFIIVATKGRPDHGDLLFPGGRKGGGVFTFDLPDMGRGLLPTIGVPRPHIPKEN